MTAVEPGLFPEPEHAERPVDGPWVVGPAPHRWRYMFLGEDSQWLMVYGHVPPGDLSDAVSVAGVDPDEEWDDCTRWTYAEMRDMCPWHLTWVEDCDSCEVLREGHGWLVLLTARADPDDAERNTPGYFPVTVVDLEA